MVDTYCGEKTPGEILINIIATLREWRDIDHVQADVQFIVASKVEGPVPALFYVISFLNLFNDSVSEGYTISKISSLWL